MTSKTNWIKLACLSGVAALSMMPLSARAQDMNSSTTTTTTTGTMGTATGTMNADGTMGTGTMGATGTMNADGTMMSGGGMMNADGTMMSGGMMAPGMMSSMTVSGQILRHYVDKNGAVTAMDVKTPTGVVQVRFSPAIPASQRPQDTYKLGSMANLTAMGMMGMAKYDPDATKESNMGMMMMQGNTTGAKPIGGLKVAGINGDMGMAKGGNGMMMSPGMGASMMMMAADGKMMAVKMAGGKAMVAMADGTMLELMKDANGSYIVPESMTGAKMVMVAPDGTTMDVDTVNGQLMVKNADGTMSAIDANGNMMSPTR
jgi:hypothetical protein